MGHIICRTTYGLYDIVNFQDQYLLSTVSCSIYFSDNIRLILVDLFWSCQTGVKLKKQNLLCIWFKLFMDHYLILRES